MNSFAPLKNSLPPFECVQSSFAAGTYFEITVFSLCYKALGICVPDPQSGASDCATSSKSTEATDRALFMVGALKDKLYEVINTGHWSLVDTKHRQAFTMATILEVLLRIDAPKTDYQTMDAIYNLDYGLIMGCPLDEPYASVLTDAIEFIRNIESVSQSTAGKRQKLDDARRSPSEICDIPILTRPSLLQFQRDHFQQCQPALLLDCMQHWPAMSKWRQTDYLTHMAGDRTVPIEVGAHYTTDEWSQDLVRFKEFMARQITTEATCDRIEYLAQHNLFDQVPALRQDIVVPDYCCCTDTAVDPLRPDIKAWLGPKGTVSPMHHDPKHNLLCQVFGHKQIILAAPVDSVNLYPHAGAMLQNTSQIDAEAVDLHAFPLAGHVKFYKLTLYTGEMLYLPPGWWHHIRALDKSFSVSFWWE